MGGMSQLSKSGGASYISRGAAALFMLGFLFSILAPPVAAQKQKQKPQKLEKSYQEWLDRDVAYIITKEERNAFLKLTTDDDRDRYIQDFWELRNPTPGSPENTYKDDIYKRIAYANASFGSGANEEGWRTDRGRAYITLGPPQQKEVHYNAANMFPLEVWFYSYTHPSLPPFFYIMFYKHEGFGDFRFYSPFIDGPDKLMAGTEYINDYQGSIQAIQDSVGPLIARLSQSLIPNEPIDSSQGRPSLQSDAMLATIKGLADNPFSKDELNRRRALFGSVTARIMIPGQNLDVATFPVRDSRGMTRLDYAMRFRQSSDLAIEPASDGSYSYNMQAQVRVYDSAKADRLIFTQEQNVAETLDKLKFSDITSKRVGYEGSLPLPPGKYHLEFILTDWKKKRAFQATKDVVVPEIDPSGVTIAGLLPFSSVVPYESDNADITPFTLAGLRFLPLGTNPLTLPSDEAIQFAYEIWAPPQDPADYADQKMTVEYAVGRPGAEGGARGLSDEVAKNQFDPMGTLVSGKKLPLLNQFPGSYLLSVTIDQPGPSKRAFSTLNFSVVPGFTTPDVWDVTDPSLAKEAADGSWDRQRALCLVAQSKLDEARPWLRRALARNHSDEIARSRLVEAYSARKDYAAIQSLYKDAGISDETDGGTILQIAEGLDQTGGVKDAISFLESTLRTREENGALYLALAGYYRDAGDSKKAAEAESKGKPFLTPPASR
jgi:GWxTD domain-containing protein